MGQVPAKYFYPSPPYGSSDAVGTLNAVQPSAMNPQTPLLPPSFTDPGTTIRSGGSGTQAPAAPMTPALGAPGSTFSNQRRALPPSAGGGDLWRLLGQ